MDIPENKGGKYSMKSHVINLSAYAEGYSTQFVCLSVFVCVQGYLIHFFVIILCFCCLKQLSD